MSPLPRVAKVARTYKRVYESSIRLRKGETVNVYREDDRYPGWFWCARHDGQTGWVPKEVLLSTEGGETLVLEDYNAEELSAETGETLTLLREFHGWAWARNASGKEAWFPVDHLESSGLEEDLSDT